MTRYLSCILRKCLPTSFSGLAKGDTDNTRSQIDRLWWIWQQQDPFHRNEEYQGLAFSDSMDAASMGDVLSMGTYLAPDVKVEDVMAADYGGVLCYNYTITEFF